MKRADVMSGITICLLTALLPAGAPRAETPAKPAASFAGTYVGGDRNYQQEIEIKKRADGGFDVEATVGTKGCAGSIEAQGNAEGDKLRASAKSEDGGETCTLTLTRTKRGVKVESENCNSFHGASCEFDGNYRRKR